MEAVVVFLIIVCIVFCIFYQRDPQTSIVSHVVEIDTSVQTEKEKWKKKYEDKCSGYNRLVQKQMETEKKLQGETNQLMETISLLQQELKIWKDAYNFEHERQMKMHHHYQTQYHKMRDTHEERIVSDQKRIRALCQQGLENIQCTTHLVDILEYSIQRRKMAFIQYEKQFYNQPKGRKKKKK